MAISANQVMSEILILALLITVSLDLTVGQIGIAYGTNGDNIVPPSQVVELFNNYEIQRMRIYENYPEILPAVEGSNIELTISIQNRDLGGIAADQANADAWVLENISKYPNINFRHIVVGNEVSPVNPGTSEYVPSVLPALQNVYNAISTVGLAGAIQVTTAIDTGVLNKSYPPYEGEFRPDVTDYLNPIIGFLLDTDAPLFANIYPYFAYRMQPDVIPLPYALLDRNFEGVQMPNGVVYQNLFYALVDAVYAALEKSAAAMSSDATTEAGRSIKKMVVIGGESGWSSGGGHATRIATDDVDVSNPDNAGTYVNNLIQAVKYGTPLRPDQPIETYIFAMFDEDLKQGEEIEKHFGLFTPDGQPKYQLSFN